MNIAKQGMVRVGEDPLRGTTRGLPGVKKAPKWYSKRLFNALIERDGRRCAYCGTTKKLTIDHVTPRARGGSLEMHNLQVLCWQCNHDKGCSMP